MKVKIGKLSTKTTLLIIYFLFPICVKAQLRDSTFVGTYPQKFRLTGNFSTSFLQVSDGTNTYTPNYPLSTGIGIALKNTVFSINAGYGFIPLKNKRTYGKSKIVDFQLHNYGRKIILDLFIQKYRGFYTEKKIGHVDEFFPQMAVIQIGGEGTYIINSEQFSSKAAFDLNEIQYKSAGSWLLGGGAFYYQTKGMKNNKDVILSNHFENVQLGLNAGYAYSLVINNQWMISVMAKGGANLGNTIENIKKFKTEIYPTAYARFAANYYKRNWGVSMVVMVENKSLYPLNTNDLNLTTVTMQLSYVKHFNNLFKKFK
ncbi:DUF4421 family protein [Chryseobacterium sp. C39-AII1]|uniref:DUF4421 family protein n=1 Tax=Chryseobacterium sp. C39-AII1 TaxID=3080332 RepID=UPI00320B3ADF